MFSKRRSCRRCAPVYWPVDVRPVVIKVLIALAVLMGIALLALIQ